MDYRELLKKYITHVLDCEGWDYLDSVSTSPSTQYTVAFTEEEINDLNLIAEEARND